MVLDPRNHSKHLRIWSMMHYGYFNGLLLLDFSKAPGWPSISASDTYLVWYLTGRTQQVQLRIVCLHRFRPNEGRLKVLCLHHCYLRYTYIIYLIQLQNPFLFANDSTLPTGGFWYEMIPLFLNTVGINWGNHLGVAFNKFLKWITKGPVFIT